MGLVTRYAVLLVFYDTLGVLLTFSSFWIPLWVGLFCFCLRNLGLTDLP